MQQKIFSSLALFPGPCHFSYTKERSASNVKLGWGLETRLQFHYSMAYSAPVKYKKE